MRVVDFGPLMASLQQRGKIHDSELMAEWRVYADELFTELLLRVYWSERHKQLKLTVPLPGAIKRRWDGIAGGELERATDGKERPVRDRTLIELENGRSRGTCVPRCIRAGCIEQSPKGESRIRRGGRGFRREWPRRNSGSERRRGQGCGSHCFAVRSWPITIRSRVKGRAGCMRIRACTSFGSDSSAGIGRHRRVVGPPRVHDATAARGGGLDEGHGGALSGKSKVDNRKPYVVGKP